MTLYSFTNQIKIVMTCFSIHNFLWKILVTSRLHFEYDNEVVELESDNNFFQTYNQVFMQQLDQIANELFQIFN